MTKIFFLKLLLTLFISCNFGFVAFSQYQHDSIKTDHGYLHYYIKGQGKPVVLLQGNPGSSSYYMRMIADQLEGYQLILVDYQGTGKSIYQKADSSWTHLDNIVKDYNWVREHLKIDNWTMVGHSYGGQHALYYATKYPKSVQKVISIGGVTTDNQLMKYWFDNLQAYSSEQDQKELAEIISDEKLKPAEQIRKLMELYARSAFYDKSKTQVLSDFYPDEELLISTNSNYQKAWMERSDFFTLDFSMEIYALNLPIRIIQGRQDPVGERVPIILDINAKDSKLTFIEKCGHFPWIEHPEQFYPILKSYIEN